MNTVIKARQKRAAASRRPRARDHKARAREASIARIIGSDALVARYELALGDAGMLAERGIADAAAHGLWRVAQRAGLVTTSPVNA